ncbi:MAG: hydroxymethylbilane synthase [Myxococcales bacterium]|nr:hydroxymethylbilane synthase [Myxococcales bacterium]
MKIRIGTRGSALALWQADHIAARLREAHGEAVSVERVIYKTRGDHILDRPLADIGGKGLFTKELEVGLADHSIDIAVHSLKDMPTALPDGLVLGAIPVRGDVRDCLLTRPGEPIEPKIIGTASLRRTCLARRRWPEAQVEPIRGNVQTRLGRLHEDGARRVDLVVLAMAGVIRMRFPEEREDVSFLPLNPEQWIPAVGQGALAIECRADDKAVRDALAVIHHADTAACTKAERAFLRGVEGDCRVPVGAYATCDRGNLRLRAFVGDPDGHEMYVHTAVGTDAAALGAEVAEHVLDAGGRAVLERLRAR